MRGFLGRMGAGFVGLGEGVASFGLSPAPDAVSRVGARAVWAGFAKSRLPDARLATVLASPAALRARLASPCLAAALVSPAEMRARLTPPAALETVVDTRGVVIPCACP